MEKYKRVIIILFLAIVMFFILISSNTDSKENLKKGFEAGMSMNEITTTTELNN